jgi:hypothetical protein
LKWLLEIPEFFAFVYPHNGSIHALAPASIALNGIQVSALRVKVTPTLEFLQHIPSAHRPPAAKKSYDPVGAQIHELTGPAFVALEEKLNSIERTFEQATRRKAPQELAAIRANCRDQVHQIREWAQIAREQKDTIPILLTSVSLLAAVLTEGFSLFSDLEQKLRDYLDPSTQASSGGLLQPGRQAYDPRRSRTIRA